MEEKSGLLGRMLFARMSIQSSPMFALTATYGPSVPTRQECKYPLTTHTLHLLYLLNTCYTVILTEDDNHCVT
jgi:hypothetical protein